MYVHAYTRAPMGPKKGQKRVLGITLAGQTVLHSTYTLFRGFGVPDRSRTVSGPNGTIWTPVQGRGDNLPGGPPKTPELEKKFYQNGHKMG